MQFRELREDRWTNDQIPKTTKAFENAIRKANNDTFKDDDTETGKTSSKETVQVKDDPEGRLEVLLQAYFRDLRSKSEYPDTIPQSPFGIGDLKRITPEENKEKREEFQEKKAELKKQWEELNGMPWPKYKYDVYSASGKLIRKAGSDYDAHHIQPLGLGGKNEASNITPINAEVHYDKQGVHAPNSPYSMIDKMLGGTEQ